MGTLYEHRTVPISRSEKLNYVSFRNDALAPATRATSFIEAAHVAVEKLGIHNYPCELSPSRIEGCVESRPQATHQTSTTPRGLVCQRSVCELFVAPHRHLSERYPLLPQVFHQRECSGESFSDLTPNFTDDKPMGCASCRDHITSFACTRTCTHAHMYTCPHVLS